MAHLHILGISGTFMSALAILAREAGYTISGCDAACYPPVSDLLAEKGIHFEEGYQESDQVLKADEVIIGNAIKRGMPVLEQVLKHRKDYTSGPQWLAENILSRYKVIAVSGTHGKTTTTAMIVKILDEAGLEPGFLIGGVAPDFKTSARLGKGEWFVIEADEYDSAFFDKRPKFMHYRPEIAIINNLEFDHADIYPDLAAIQQQFHYLIKTLPDNAQLIYPRASENIRTVLEKGIFSQHTDLAINDVQAEWSAKMEGLGNASFELYHKGSPAAKVNWGLLGRFNAENGLAAAVASIKAGVGPETAARALESFTPVKRRMELKGTVNNITVYDDFAHHPTAVFNSIEALKNSNQYQRVMVVLEFASYTMRSGFHQGSIGQALEPAECCFILKPSGFSLDNCLGSNCYLYEDVEEIINAVSQKARPGDAVLVMSNRGFDGIHQKLLKSLQQRL